MTVHLEERLQKRDDRGNLRRLQLTHNLIDFSSNDYLGLARSADLAESILQTWTKNGKQLGSTGSRLLTGNCTYVEALENRIAAFHGFEAGLIFNCGYMANSGLISSLGDRNDVILFDAGVHASMREGITLSKSACFPFKHNDLMHFELRLHNAKESKNRFICVESIYSTDGSRAPLREICRLAKTYAAHVIVDEAHAVGVCGPQGRGLVAEENLISEVFAQVVTFGKALGVQGAIVLGSEILKQMLINFAKPYVYTTALPFYSLAAIASSYDLFPLLEAERAHLRKLARMLSPSSATAIHSVSVKGNALVRQISQMLAKRGFDVRPLMSPTVQQGHERLRICLHAFNTEDEVEALNKYIRKVL